MSDPSDWAARPIPVVGGVWVGFAVDFGPGDGVTRRGRRDGFRAAGERP